MNAIQAYIAPRLSSHVEKPSMLADDIARLYRYNRIVRGQGMQSAMLRALSYVWLPNSRPALYYGDKASWGRPFGDRDKLRWVESWEAAGLRFIGWADEIISDLRHTGWHCCPYGEGMTLRGGVWQLPGRKGTARLVYGYAEFEGRGEMNPGSAAIATSEVIETRDNYEIRRADETRDAARFADSIAERRAEAERDYQESYAAGRVAAESDNLYRETRRGLLPLLAEFRLVRRGRSMVSEVVCDLMQKTIRERLAEMERERASRETAWGDCPTSAEPAWLAGFMDMVDGQGFVRAVRLGYAKASDWKGAASENPCYSESVS